VGVRPAMKRTMSSKSLGKNAGTVPAFFLFALGVHFAKRWIFPIAHAFSPSVELARITKADNV
jgi:Sec-independent protein secretion pathway component TatC